MVLNFLSADCLLPVILMLETFAGWPEVCSDPQIRLGEVQRINIH